MASPTTATTLTDSTSTRRQTSEGSKMPPAMVTTFPPLRVITKVRCPRSMPSASMSAFAASETRSPLRASREISACSAGGPSPAATRSAPSSLRSRPVAWDS